MLRLLARGRPGFHPRHFLESARGGDKEFEDRSRRRSPAPWWTASPSAGSSSPALAPKPAAAIICCSSSSLGLLLKIPSAAASRRNNELQNSNCKFKLKGTQVMVFPVSFKRHRPNL